MQALLSLENFLASKMFSISDVNLEKAESMFKSKILQLALVCRDQLPVMVTMLCFVTHTHTHCNICLNFDMHINVEPSVQRS